MMTAIAILAYVAFGFGFAGELCRDNPMSKSWSVQKKAVVAVLIFATWPLGILVRLGVKAGE